MRALVPAFGTALLLVAASSAGFLVLNSAFPSANVIDRDTNSRATSAGDPTTSTPLLVPTIRPDIYFAAISDRPVFVESRRPLELTVSIVEEDPEPSPIREPEPEVEVDVPAPNLVLHGVLTGGAKSSALVSLDGAEPEWIREGTEIAGWRLTTIEADAIELSETDRSLRIELY